MGDAVEVERDEVARRRESTGARGQPAEERVPRQHVARARRIKADPATSAIPVVALTAYTMKGDAERALEAGCSGYLAKPVDTRTPADTVARFLDEPGAAA